MATQTLDTTEFRGSFPAYQNATTYPDAQLLAMFSTAGMYIPLNDSCLGMSGATLNWALQLLTAHLLYIAGLIARGQTAVIVTSSSIDKINVNLLAPPTKDIFDWWLMTSPYGQQLAAMLDVQSVGGFTFGGGPETAAFRKVGGRF